MAQKTNARAGDAGASKPGGFGANNTPPQINPQQPWRVRALIRSLSDAARAGSLAPWDTQFIASIMRQAELRRWLPSPKQAVVLQRIAADLAESDTPLIDDTDTEFPVSAGMPADGLFGTMKQMRKAKKC